MRLVDKNICIDVSRVNPIATKILRESTPGHHKFRLHRSHSHTFRRLFGRVQGITFGRNRSTKVQIIVPILQEAPILFILSTLLRIRHSKVVILPDEPIPQATELDDAVKRARHSLAFLVRDIKLLVLDQELRPGCLTRLNQGVLVVAFARKTEPILVRKLPHALQRRSTIHGHIILVEHRDEVLFGVDVVADLLDRGLFVVREMRARRLRLLKDVHGSDVGTHATITRLAVLEDERVVASVAFRDHAAATQAHRCSVQDGGQGSACFP